MTDNEVRLLNKKLKCFNLWMGFYLVGGNRTVYFTDEKGIAFLYGKTMYFTDDEILQYIREHGIEEFATMVRLELNFSGDL